MPCPKFSMHTFSHSPTHLPNIIKEGHTCMVSEKSLAKKLWMGRRTAHKHLDYRTQVSYIIQWEDWMTIIKHLWSAWSKCFLCIIYNQITKIISKHLKRKYTNYVAYTAKNTTIMPGTQYRILKLVKSKQDLKSILIQMIQKTEMPTFTSIGWIKQNGRFPKLNAT